MGFEIELLAPPGQSRLTLAEALARNCGGSTRRFFHPQSEPSKVPGSPVFHNLTLGFEVLDSQQNWVASCVDDLTLLGDLVKQTPPRDGWYRIVSDDERLLRLIEKQADPRLPLEEVLRPVAALFGTSPQPGPDGMIRVNDHAGASVAIGARLPGERERPCELISAPLDVNHRERLEALLSSARELGFSAPLEGATHLHFDATALQSAPVMANLVRFFHSYGELLKALLGTNPNCHRLGRWPDELLTTVNAAEFEKLGWEEARLRLRRLPLTKYCDFNLVNCVHERPRQKTFEVRVLPVWLEAEPVLNAAALIVAILKRCLASEKVPSEQPRPACAQTLNDFFQTVRLSGEQMEHWSHSGLSKRSVQ